MRGSFDHPPIVIRTRRWKAALRLGVVVLLAALCAPVARTYWLGDSSAWLLILIFGALAIASLWELARPGRLIVGPDGFEQRNLWWARRWSWAEARHFAPANNRFYDFVGFHQVPRPAPPGKGPWLRSDGLNEDWELDPPALAALLNRARSLWFVQRHDTA